MSGSLSYSLPSLKSVAAVSGAVAGKTGTVFSHIATTQGFFTGIAILNPGKLAANLRVTAAKADGSVLGTFTTVLLPGERLSRLIDELIPQAAGQAGGFIQVRSDIPVYTTSLFGNLANGVLANIPGQPIPADFRADAGQPSLRVTPPFAVVSPGSAVDFALEGASQTVEWSVNGVVGGNALLGSVENGRFRAPDELPSPLPVNVTASTDAQTLGASVDVLSDQLLLEGLGIVRSVAHLEALDRIFTAEFGPAGFANASPPRETPAPVGSRMSPLCRSAW